MKQLMLAILIAVMPALGDRARGETIGNFAVQFDVDRFTSKPEVIAVTSNAYGTLALRCLAGERSVAIGDASLEMSPGEVLAVKFRADKKPASEISATALNAHLAQVGSVGSAMVLGELLGASEIAFRITSQTETHDLVFELQSTTDAVRAVYDACP